MEKEKLTKKQILRYTLLSLAMLLGVVAIAYGSYLSFTYLIIISVISIAIIPFIIKAWIKQKRSLTKFEHLCNYLTNIIPVFMQKTKIRFALGELFEICDGEVKNVIGDAIKYIDATRNDPDLLKNGLKIIEDKFNNSRVESVHKFLLSVENTNSETYKDIAENLDKDIEEWIKRTYNFEKDINNRQIKILFLCILTLVMNVLFVFVYVSNDFFTGFVDNVYYQMSTFAFILFVLITMAILIVKLNGEWLIEDRKKGKDDLLKERYRHYKKGDHKLKPIDIVIFLIVIALGTYFFIIDVRYATYLLALIAVLFISKKRRKYISCKKYITKQLTIEFPMWLREISLSLGNLTVLNAIENSLDSASYALRREIRYFLKDAKDNPTSIKPYNDFLDEYGIDEVKSSMRVLYAVNNVSKKDMKGRVAKLIDRNQELLAKSERIRNYDSIGGVEAIGYFPTILFSVHMMISMIIMFNYMLNLLGGQL
ncbi:MAG: hypothetical protein Q4F12_04775 [Erysipelotrichaceae bacterium]|nr:hypothetical protein [Erysipelotrichaceae bacterium]